MMMDTKYQGSSFYFLGSTLYNSTETWDAPGKGFGVISCQMGILFKTLVEVHYIDDAIYQISKL